MKFSTKDTWNNLEPWNTSCWRYQAHASYIWASKIQTASPILRISTSPVPAHQIDIMYTLQVNMEPEHDGFLLFQGAIFQVPC